MLITDAQAERFWTKVSIRDPDECWPWLASVFGRGYGQYRIGSKDTRRLAGAHVVAYVLDKGEVPEGLWVLHTCDNILCCNPGHLYAGTPMDNVRDMHTRGRAVTITKFTEAERMAAIADPRSLSAIARDLGMCRQYVHDLKTKKRKYRDRISLDTKSVMHYVAGA